MCGQYSLPLGRFYLARLIALRARRPRLARRGNGRPVRLYTEREVLQAAIRIAVSRNWNLTVLAGENSGWRAYLPEIVDQLGSAAPQITEHWVFQATIEDLRQLAAMPPDDLLVVALDSHWFSEPGALSRLASGRRAPVLLIEPEQHTA